MSGVASFSIKEQGCLYSLYQTGRDPSQKHHRDQFHTSRKQTRMRCSRKVGFLSQGCGCDCIYAPVFTDWLDCQKAFWEVQEITKYKNMTAKEYLRLSCFPNPRKTLFFCSPALALLSRFNLAAVISVGLNHSWLNQYTLRVEPSYLLQACMQILQRHWITRRNLQIMLILVFCNVFVLLLSARQVYLCSTCPTQRQKTRRYVKENK